MALPRRAFLLTTTTAAAPDRRGRLQGVQHVGEDLAIGHVARPEQRRARGEQGEPGKERVDEGSMQRLLQSHSLHLLQQSVGPWPANMVLVTPHSFRGRHSDLCMGEEKEAVSDHDFEHDGASRGDGGPREVPSSEGGPAAQEDAATRDAPEAPMDASPAGRRGREGKRVKRRRRRGEGAAEKAPLSEVWFRFPAGKTAGGAGGSSQGA